MQLIVQVYSMSPFAYAGMYLAFVQASLDACDVPCLVVVELFSLLHYQLEATLVVWSNCHLQVMEHPKDASEGKVGSPSSWVCTTCSSSFVIVQTEDLMTRHERDIMNVYIASSRNGLDWDISSIYSLEPCIERGPPGSFYKDGVYVMDGGFLTHEDGHSLFFNGCTVHMLAAPPVMQRTVPE
jgi:hypothetical protein